MTDRPHLTPQFFPGPDASAQSSALLRSVRAAIFADDEADGSTWGNGVTEFANCSRDACGLVMDGQQHLKGWAGR